MATRDMQYGKRHLSYIDIARYKKIKRIVPIGMAENMKRDGYEWKYREILLGIGMTNEQLQIQARQ